MKQHIQSFQRCLVSVACVAIVAGCRSGAPSAPEPVETRQAAVYSSDPGTVAPGTPLQLKASCPGKTFPDQCGGWEGVELSATKDSADQRCLCRPIAFEVPASLPVTKGSAGGGTAFLTFRKDGNQFQKCIYVGNERTGKSGKKTGGDAYELVTCTDRSRAGCSIKADWFSLEVNGGNPQRGPTEVSVRLGAPDVVNGVVQEEILYATDPRIPGAALHIPRGAAPPNQEFSISVLPQPAVGSTIANGEEPVVTTGYAVDVHATGVDQFAFADVPGAACPRIDLPYSPAALGPGAEARLRARQITDLAGLSSGASVLAPTSEVTIDPVNHIVSFCVSHLSYYVTMKKLFDAELSHAYITTPPARPCSTAADCGTGEVCDGNCYVDLFGPSPPPLVPSSPYILHLDFNNNGTNTWTTSSVHLWPVTAGFPPLQLTPSPWSADVPQNLGADVLATENASFDVNVISPATPQVLDLCLMNGLMPFGECFSWDPPHSMTGSGMTPVALSEICDGVDNDLNGQTDDLNGNVVTAPGQPCDNGQSGSCFRAGSYVCDGRFATRCDTPGVTQNACGGCTSLPQQPDAACDTGGPGPCGNPGLVQCNGPDAITCVAGPMPPANACGGCVDLGVAIGSACNTQPDLCTGGSWQCDGGNAVTCVCNHAPFDELKFETTPTLSSWFGGDDRPSFTPRSVGEGQTVIVPRAIDLKRFAFRFSQGFWKDTERTTTYGATLVLQLRNANGAIIGFAETVVPASYKGGWVFWPMELMLAPGTYHFTAYVKDGLTLEINTGIVGVAGGSDRDPGRRLASETRDSDADFASFTAWSGDGAAVVDLFYWLQGYFP